ncbi:hypothetical protein NX784_08420 [Massilia pinisoli]|uniref:MarR family transcriptional regulator n=1 Tax=Massilia pinisoli TaxID=1772194 RepID=A0ABT1ZNZ4_9BURK|nr:hypothetical protein [Massilia pinisoli]MCS0581615.1 hypothetical protein [Massilia pinisoli]
MALDTSIYAKTAKGRDEVASRGMGLNGRQRTVLILLDGRKPCGALASLMTAGQVADIVGQLLALDLIEPRAADGGPPAAQPERARETSRGEHDAHVARVKRYMVQTAQAHLGLLAAEVVGRIERTNDADQLRSVVGYWHMALRDAKDGRATACAHLEHVRAGLRDAGVPA